MSTDIQDQLLDFISENFRIEKEEIDLEDSLVDQGVIDSFGFVEIAAFLEKTCAITVTDEQITPENFSSVANIVAFAKSAAKA